MRRANAVTTARAEPGEFVDLYERTMTEVYSYLASRVADRGAAEDLTQDVFVSGANRAAAGDPVDLPWCYFVASETCARRASTADRVAHRCSIRKGWGSRLA